MSTLTKDSLELAQLVKDVTDAKRALQRPGLTMDVVAFPVGRRGPERATLFELFTAIDKLEAFYKVP